MNSIKDLREQINQIDHEIIKKLHKRFEIVKKIGFLKKESEQEVFDSIREDELFDLYDKWSKELDLDTDLIKKIFREIMNKSQEEQL